MPLVVMSQASSLSPLRFTDIKRICLVCLCIGILIYTQLVTYASNTNIHIEIHASEVANLYYEIYIHNKPAKNNIAYEIYDENNGCIISSKTNNNILFYPNLPFGVYDLVILDEHFCIEIDENYLRTQHILKPLYLQSISTQTSDDNQISFYLITLFVSGYLLRRAFYA